MPMKRQGNYTLPFHLLSLFLLLVTFLLCVCAGSVAIPLRDTLHTFRELFFGLKPTGTNAVILRSIRLPRVICVGLVGSCLSLCGCAMQGLLRNPLADGSTLGVSSGASFGAVLSLALGLRIPGLTYGTTMVFAMLFAFLSLVLILSLAYALDRSLATNSIILIGIIFSMFASALISLTISFAGERIKSITFWTMGSLSGATYTQALILLVSLILGSVILLSLCDELNAFALSEENAWHIGVHVRRVKLTVLITVSMLIGVCVSIGGSIAFVGLVVPHMLRLLLGPGHRRLLPASLYGGAIFLMLADLLGRTLLSPIELPIGVVTSLFGAVAFILIFRHARKTERGIGNVA